MDDLVVSFLSDILYFLSTERSVDMLDLFSQMTLDVILSTAFGLKTNIQTDPHSPVTKEAERLFRRVWLSPFLQVFPCSTFIRRIIAYFRQGLAFFLGAATEIVNERKKHASKGRNDHCSLS